MTAPGTPLRLGPMAMFVALLLVGCVASGTPATPPPSSGASARPGGGELPPGCEPIDLRSPNGQQIDLGGAWSGPQPWVGFFQSSTETTWIRQLGDCVWGSVMDAEFRSNPNFQGTFEQRGGNLGSLVGRITSDFAIEAQLISIRHGSPAAPSPAAAIRLLIEFGPDGATILREERDPDELSPRCYEVQGDPYCPAAVILHRVEDLE
jgi:hypothetical protein